MNKIWLVAFLSVLSPAFARAACTGAPITRAEAFKKFPENNWLGVFARAHAYARERACTANGCAAWSATRQLPYPSSRYEDEIYFLRGADPAGMLRLGMFNGLEVTCENVGEPTQVCTLEGQPLRTAIVTNHCFEFVFERSNQAGDVRWEIQAWTQGRF